LGAVYTRTIDIRPVERAGILDRDNTALVPQTGMMARYRYIVEKYVGLRVSTYRQHITVYVEAFSDFVALPDNEEWALICGNDGIRSLFSAADRSERLR